MNTAIKIILSLGMLAGMSSCKSNSSDVYLHLKGADSLAISFNQLGTDNILKTVSTTEPKAIRKLIHFIDAKKTESYKCGYDGTLVFYKSGARLSEVPFNYSGSGCMNFLLKIDGNFVTTQMSDEASDFLESLALGRDWY